jgi:zinc protease
MLKKFHDTWYTPNNAVLVVVGDIDPTTTLERIKSLFGAIQPKSLPLRAPIVLKPVNRKPIMVETDRPVATRMIAMRLPGLNSPDFPALELLADVLASHRFELYGLVPQGKAIRANFSIDSLPEASIGAASISIRPGGDIDGAEQEIRKILVGVTRDGVPADLVAAAKIQEHREAEFSKNSVENLASAWSDAIALNGLQSPEEGLMRIDKVTPEEVNRVARKYLRLENAVSMTTMPRNGKRSPIAEVASSGRENITLDEAKSTLLPVWAQHALDHMVMPQSTLHPVVSTLPNGITLIVQPEDVSDTVSVYGHIKNRPETETAQGKDGVAEVLNGLFKYGSTHLDRVSFQEKLDSIGARERAGPDFELQTLTRDFDRGVSLLADNELHPALSEQALQTVRDQLRDVVGARMQSPGFLASKSLRESLFAKGDPSLREPLPEGINGLTMDDVLSYYHTAFRPDLTTIVVIGKISPNEARKIIEREFGGWSATGPKPDTNLPVAATNRSASLAVPDESKIQDAVALAENVPLTRKDPDYYALELGNAVLSGGFYSSRLSIDLRKKMGLVYSVDSELQSGQTRSVYLVSYACDPHNVGKAANIVSQELTDMQTIPISQVELTRAKAFLLRQMTLDEDSVRGNAQELIGRHDLDLPLDESTVAANRYQALSASDVQGAFLKWLRPKDLVQVSQGPMPQ